MSLPKNILRRGRKLLQRFSANLVLALLLLMEIGIFVIDIDTAASLSFSPFLAVPTALSAWFLNRRTTLLFVSLSSAARVYDFSIMEARNDTLAMLLYELAQSALFYGILAALVDRMRSQAERLSRHAEYIRLSVRSERHRHRLEASIRRAVPADVDAIIRLTTLGAHDGAFDESVSGAVRKAALAASFSQGIVDGAALRDLWSGGTTIVPIEFWVSEINHNIAGFLMILGMDQHKGAERELHAITVDHAYRGLGVGSVMTDFFCSHYKQRRLFAACKPDSTMLRMLQRRGFHQHATSTSGHEIVARG